MLVDAEKQYVIRQEENVLHIFPTTKVSLSHKSFERRQREKKSVPF
jgi:hypothetical protein